MNEPERQIMSILGEAVEYRSPEERAAFLEKACAGDTDRRARVEALLRAHEAAGNFLRGDPSREPVTTVDEAGREQAGMVIGPYKLIEPIGEGGMGSVWMAQQQEPVRRLVAVKFIKAGMDSRQVVSRFKAERQALALMDHPNIARVLDGGTTQEGRPYFVMELVKGVPITQFCDNNRLTPRKRLELFVSVCHAVQHAHQKGVIHRDIKPSNVLVTAHDGTPVAKVIDFGIAKAVGQQLTDKTVYTGLAQMIGTPLYVSPEQAGTIALDVDTRTDVYALGVLLYELLTGSTPFEAERLRKAGFDEVRRIIREEEPPRPSARITATGRADAARARGQGDPRCLSRLCRGELDWVVMKCLEKDRDRRYETANALAVDVQRYLADEPVLACPPSAWYRLRKLVRRNKGPVLTVTLVVLALVGGMIGTTWGMLRATHAEAEAIAFAREKEQQREKADEARKEAVESLATARKAVQQMLVRLGADKLNFVPQMGDVKREVLRDAASLYEELLRRYPDDLELQQEAATVNGWYGQTLARQGDVPGAEKKLRQALAVLERLEAKGVLDRPGREQMIRSYTNLGWLLTAVPGRRADGVEAHRQAFLRAEALAKEVPDSRIYRDGLVSTCLELGNVWRPTRPREAEAMLRRAIAGLSESGSNRHYLGRAHLALGELCVQEERLVEAEQAFSQAKALYETQVAASPRVWPSSERLADTLVHLGRVLVATGRVQEGERLFRRAVALWEKLIADNPPVPLLYRDSLAISQSALLMVLDPARHGSEAEDLTRTLREARPGSVHAQARLAWALANAPDEKWRDPPRAVALAQQAAEHDPERAVHWRALALARYRVGKHRQALLALEKARASTGRDDGLELFVRALASWQKGDKDEAKRAYNRATKWTRDHRPADPELARMRREAEKMMGPN